MIYENCLVGFACGIRRLRDELARLQKEERKERALRRGSEGDEDDWFLVGKEVVRGGEDGEGEMRLEEVEGRETLIRLGGRGKGEIRVKLDMAEVS